MSKNILFYIPTIDQRAGGIRQYSYNLLRVIAEQKDADYSYFIFHKRKDKLFLDIINERSNFHLVPTFFIVKTSFKFINIFLKPFGKKLEFLDYIIKKLNISIVHCPYQFAPRTKKAKVICTMHDVQEIHFPEFFTEKELASRSVHYRDYIERSDAIMVSFDHVKQDIVKYFGIEESKISTMLIGINSLWINAYFNGKALISVKTRFDDFILYPANAWKHKNHIALIEALRILKEDNKVVNLVLTGDFSSDNGQILIGKIHEYGLEDAVELKGIISQDELYGLYQKALGVVIPTLYEAGSYPLYESICIEKAVVCSNVTSLPETIGDERFVFDPYNVQDIAEKIEKLYFDNDYKNESIANSKRMKSILHNNNSIDELYKLYQKL